MPKYHETERKIEQIRKGYNVRAPKVYWNMLMREAKKEYPDLLDFRLRLIAGNRWKNISNDKKIEIIKEYQESTDIKPEKDYREELGRMR